MCLTLFSVVTKHHKWGGLINNRNFFLMVLEAGSPSSSSQHSWCLVHRWQSSHWVLTGQNGERISLESLFTRALILHDLITPTIPPPNNITVGITTFSPQHWARFHFGVVEMCSTR